MTLIERARERALHCACGHDGDCYHYKLIDALEAAQAMADAIMHSLFCNAFGPTPMDCSCSHAEALAKFQEAMNDGE